MPATSDPAQAAYLAQRPAVNAHWRRRFALALLCVAAGLGLTHFLSGSLSADGVLAPPESFALAVAYLGCIGLLALLAGPRPRACGARVRAPTTPGLHC